MFDPFRCTATAQGRCENRSVIDEIVAGKDVGELVTWKRTWGRHSPRCLMVAM
jgi:hypothetical protein